MKIGEHEVTAITRNTVKVGCQTVKREEIEKILADMKAVPDRLKLTIGTQNTGVPETVYLEQYYNDAVLVRIVGPRGQDWAYQVVKITPDGIFRSTGCDGVGIPLENPDGHYAAVKLLGFS